MSSTIGWVQIRPRLLAAAGLLALFAGTFLFCSAMEEHARPEEANYPHRAFALGGILIALGGFATALTASWEVDPGQTIARVHPTKHSQRDLVRGGYSHAARRPPLHPAHL